MIAPCPALQASGERPGETEALLPSLSPPVPRYDIVARALARNAPARAYCAAIGGRRSVSLTGGGLPFDGNPGKTHPTHRHAFASRC
jgi:hypothetical protein